jgi:tellurite resistance protein TerC
MQIWLWFGFFAFILVMLTLDLGVLNRRAHVISTREALTWTIFCVLLALAFNVLIYFAYQNNWLDIAMHDGVRTSGRQAVVRFFTGWVIEQSLSLDNIFVIALIFQYFCVPLQYQHRTLFWGILGALVMRLGMIYAGTELIQRFGWMIYLFGALLLYTAYKMFRSQDAKIEPDKNPFVRIARRCYPVTSDFQSEKFFARLDGRRAITPLFLVLLVIESTDLLFAIDSIPAIIAITRDPFLVFTSNVFAILNLRTLYFLLASALDKFKYLKPSLVFVLAFIGVKMMISYYVPINSEISLVVVVIILSAGIIASMIATRRVGPAQG